MKLNEIHARWDSLDDSVKSRIAVEAKIVAKTLRGIAATGNWTLVGIDLDEGIEPTPTFEDAMKLAFDLDEARVYFRNVKTKKSAWVYFVFGNDGGYEVISDYTLSPDGFQDVLDKLTAESADGEEEV